jgi:hypothetical protein
MARSAAYLARPIASGYQWLAVIAACLLMAACSGIEPMAFPDNRENPTFPGVFTGKQGEWIIYRKEE